MIVVILALTMFLSSCSAAAEEFIIKLRPDFVENEFPEGIKITRKFKSGAMLIDSNIPDLYETMQSDPGVEYIEPNHRLSVMSVGTATIYPITPGDPMYNQQYGLQKISAERAWENLGHSSGKIVVAVIDTGIDYNHPDLRENIYVNTREIPGNGIDDDKNGYIDDVHGWNFITGTNDPLDDQGHGTHCAGIIGAMGDNDIGIVGVSWKIQLLPLKFLDSQGSGTIADAIKAIEYANDLGIPITSNSWGGGGYSQAMYDEIKRGQDRGHLFIAAAGNSRGNNDQTPSYPASYKLDNVISVAATDKFDIMASFSNYGKGSVHLAAPGVDILSTYKGNQYASMSGTSMATPFVSGAAAYLLARDFSGEEARKALMKVDKLQSIMGRVKSGGRLNLFNASQR